MSLAPSTGAGKDATLALHEVRRAGLEVTHGFCVYDGSTGRVRFRGTPSGLVEEMGEAGVDPCGEHREYHTFVRDGPGFRRPVPIRRGEVVEMEGHRLLDLRPGGV